MNEQQTISNEIINAFVDGELTSHERSELLEEATHSDDLKQRICEAQYLKELVQEAYPATQESFHQPVNRRRFLGHALAAGMGGVAVFTGFNMLERTGMVNSSSVNEFATGDADGDYTRVVFHVSNSDPTTANLLLDQVELVLNQYANRKKSLKVEVVANNQGLRLLQKGRSPYPDRISQLDASFNNLLFAACGNTIERLQRESSKRIEILPQAIVIRSGVLFVTRRQQQGWSYIKV
ncbi:MAG: hypothetical protein GY753_14175 [Gammaproteobacteria bacterium]|nr:hypothetical protein [Gammaproteobacteria bacterium]